MEIELVHKIDILPFDTSCIDKKYLVSYEKRNFEVSESVALFIDILKISNSTVEASLKLSELKNHKYSEDDIVAIYDKCVKPIIEQPGDKKKKGSFIWKTELIPASIVGLFPSFLKILFKKPVMFALILVIMVFEIVFFSGDFRNISLGEVDIYVILGVLALFLFSSLFHELGHATACKHFGCKHQGIGFGLYINFPVFFTDVSDIWKLPRKQRLVVNFAGVYFQLIFLIPLFIIYFSTGNNILKYFILTVNFNFIFTLNPFFKFDGYWIITDLLGVANLRERSNEFFSYIWKRLRRKNIDKDIYFLNIQKKEKISMIIYSLVVNLFFICYFGYILPRFIKGFITYIPGMLAQFVNEIAMGNVPKMNLVISLFSQLLLFIIMVYVIYKMVFPLMRKLLKRQVVNNE